MAEGPMPQAVSLVTAAMTHDWRVGDILLKEVDDPVMVMRALALLTSTAVTALAATRGENPRELLQQWALHLATHPDYHK